jgi:protein-L-isoaspartate(D-aspartate) O-methyltransferase
MNATPPGPRADRLAERERMVSQQLVERGIRSELVLSAMRRVPRESFLPESLAARAYEDNAVAVDCGQTISQPFMVGLMTERLELTPRDRVLEIGTGTGYQTAILACLAGEVYTVEWHLKLMTSAAERLRELGFTNVHYRCGDGSLGWAEKAPFDAILVAAGAPDVPEALVGQLAPGGRLVAPIGPQDDQTLVFIRSDPSGPTREEVLRCRFVRLLGEQGWHE